MTLNLMLTSRHAVYLSGDFRLVSVEDQAPLPDSYDTQKLIPVIRRDWSALIAYMGIASAPPLIDDMGQWIVDQIETIPPDGDVSVLSSRLLHVNRWLPRIRGDRRVAISAVGFRHRAPFMMLLSNFVDLDGHITVAGPQLNAYLRTPHRSEVRAVGTARPDVFERVRLVRMLMANATRGAVPHLIRQAVADINASVARRSGDAISEACVTGYMLRSGAAAIGAHGIPENAACFPNWLRRDLEKEGVIGFEPLRPVGSHASIQWKGTTAKIVKGSILRTHEIANAGSPILDGVEDRSHPPTWKSTRAHGNSSICITCVTPGHASPFA
jgi:hypothetical protein